MSDTHIMMEAFDIKEDPSKKDFTIIKRGMEIEITEARDIADHVQFRTGKTTIASFKDFILNRIAVGRLGNVFLIVSGHESCPNFSGSWKNRLGGLSSN